MSNLTYSTGSNFISSGSVLLPASAYGSYPAYSTAVPLEQAVVHAANPLPLQEAPFNKRGLNSLVVSNAPTMTSIPKRTVREVQPASFSAAPAPVYAARTIARAPAVAVAHAPAPALDQYQLNVDPNPQLVRKKPAEKVHYTQEVALKFLKPPPLQQPGDIVIKQERDVQAAPAPPLHVTQKPPPPVQPPPIVVRERPPAPPAPIEPKLLVVPGKVIPPPPRQVITERLPVIPPPPQNVMVERWLGYNDTSRRVVFHPAPKLIPAPAPKNELIQWESPDVALQTEFKFLGVNTANPTDYASKYGASLADASQLPAIAANHFRPPNGESLAVEQHPTLPRLVGDLHALSLINLDAHGLGAYKHLLGSAQAVHVADAQSSAPVEIAEASGFGSIAY